MWNMYYDLETTGLSPGQICQMSYLLENEKDEIEHVGNLYFAVDYVEPGAQAIHGLSRERLSVISYGYRFENYAEQIYGLLSNCKKIIGHNVKFDNKFIKEELRRCGYSWTPEESGCDIFDTMTSSVNICKLPKKRGSGFKNPKLGEAIEQFGHNEETVLKWAKHLFGFDSVEAHDGRYDTAAVYILYKNLTKVYDEGLAL